MDRCFEVHQEHQWAAYANSLYANWLTDPKTLDGTDKPIPVYVQESVAKKYKACKPFPFAEAEKLMGVTYFTSSFSYMLAMAIMEGATEIGIWGVDLVHGEEYEEQRPCAEYLLGIARAKGIKITIPQQSALLKSPWVYGRDDTPNQDPLWQRYTQKAHDYREKIKDLKSQIFTLEGAAHECEEFCAAFEAQRRGALNNK